jgi:purine-binding chemotaxis protein CheW
MEPTTEKTMETPGSGQVAVEEQAGSAAVSKPKIEYRMIAFSLAGRDYGIDIMKVKEISHEGKFTYVPNTAPYVLGVHNLRGEIIPIIDLRKMFNLVIAEQKAGAEQNILILKLDKLALGVVVDSIDGVTSVTADSIQPPHPIFGDINIRYISGIVEKSEKLYVILDVESIFTEKAPAPAPVRVQGKPQETAVKTADQDLKFVCEGLAGLASFHVTPVNIDWVRKRFAAWKKSRDKLGITVQFRGTEDAQEFLSDFASPSRGRLWNDGERSSFIDLFPSRPAGTFIVWNHGCGRGFDAYSILCALKSEFPALTVKVFANDGNLVEIASAPTLTLPKEGVPSFYVSAGFVKAADAGYQFIPAVRESIVFEYTESLARMEDIAADLIISRDVISYLQPEAQKMLLDVFAERLNPGGSLILGTNEKIEGEGWKAVEKNGACTFVRGSKKE